MDILVPFLAVLVIVGVVLGAFWYLISRTGPKE